MSRRSRPRPTHTAPTHTAPTGCACGLPASYQDCCGRLHRGKAEADTAEQLMRSRFSAFAVRDAAYLLRSWHPDTRPPRLALDPELRWLGLDIIGTTGGGAFHSEATVEFRAHYREHGRTGELHENSRFRRMEGRWVYLDGMVKED